jgi:hypothetical protein
MSSWYPEQVPDAAPSYIVPADYEWVARTVVADSISTKTRALDLHFPQVREESLQHLDKSPERIKK